ncbi:MAG: ComEC/Rec2 family competence protein [Oligoflexus sp.]
MRNLYRWLFMAGLLLMSHASFATVDKTMDCGSGRGEFPHYSDYSLKILSLWVSHGDATLIWLPNGEIALVDTGQHFAVKDYLMPFLEQHNIEYIDHLIITHYHGDHMAGMLEEKGKKYVGYFYDPQSKRIPVGKFWDYRSFYAGEELEIGGANFKILNSYYGNEPYGENGQSLSFVIEYRGFRYGLGGDIYADQQNRILQNFPDDVRVHVYQTNHHMHGSVSKDYLRKSDPYLFITSAEQTVYERTAYTEDLMGVVDELKGKKARFLESLLTLEHGNILIWANHQDDWNYTCRQPGVAFSKLQDNGLKIE